MTTRTVPTATDATRLFNAALVRAAKEALDTMDVRFTSTTLQESYGNRLGYTVHGSSDETNARMADYIAKLVSKRHGITAVRQTVKGLVSRGEWQFSTSWANYDLAPADTKCLGQFIGVDYYSIGD